MAVNPDKVARFWDSIINASPTFVDEMVEAASRQQGTPEFDHAADLLHAVHPDLLLILGPGRGARAEIVISAGGIKTAFPAARAVTDAAPAEVHDRFIVQTLRPRVPRGDAQDLRVRVTNNRDVHAADIRWTATQHRKKPSVCDVTLYIPGWVDDLPATSAFNEPYATPAMLLLDHLIGEWAVEMQIAGIDWRSDRNAEGLPTLLDLPDYLDRISAQ